MWLKLVEPFRLFGWRAGPLYIIARLLGALSPNLALYAYELMVQPITGEPLLSTNLAKNLSVSEIVPGHADVLRLPVSPEVIAGRFDQGARCLGVYRKGVLIGYLWFAVNQYREDEVRCNYLLAHPANSVFDFDLYVFPEHRMGIGFVAIWHEANRFLHERGVRYTFSRLTRFNVASRRSHAHLGWRCVGRAVFLRAWRLEVMAATISPYIAVSLTPGQRIGLKLAAGSPGPAVPGKP